MSRNRIDWIPYENSQIIINVSINTNIHPGKTKLLLAYAYMTTDPLPSCAPTSKLLVAFNTRNPQPYCICYHNRLTNVCPVHTNRKKLGIPI